MILRPNKAGAGNGARCSRFMPNVARAVPDLCRYCHCSTNEPMHHNPVFRLSLSLANRCPALRFRSRPVTSTACGASRLRQRSLTRFVGLQREHIVDAIRSTGREGVVCI
jgi:hypothetical protein